MYHSILYSNGTLILIDQELRREHLTPRYSKLLEGKDDGTIPELGGDRTVHNKGWDNGRRDKGMEEDERSIRELYGFEGFKINGDIKKWIAIQKAVSAELATEYEFPVQKVASRTRLRKHPVISCPTNRHYLTGAIEFWALNLVDKPLRWFYEFLNNRTDHVFDRQRWNVGGYLNMEESLNVLDQLMRWQYNDEEDKIKEFLTDLVDILDKRILKRNTLVICSPPSAGKNYFVDAICALFSNVGILGTANKSNAFPFMNAVDRRLLLWNEVNYEAAEIDTVKQLTAGDTCTVKVKNKEPGVVQRTPIICMVNQSIPLMYEEVFKERVVSHRWKKAHFLKDVTKYPYPMSIFSLLNKYEIKF